MLTKYVSFDPDDIAASALRNDLLAERDKSEEHIHSLMTSRLRMRLNKHQQRILEWTVDELRLAKGRRPPIDLRTKIYRVESTYKKNAALNALTVGYRADIENVHQALAESLARKYIIFFSDIHAIRVVGDKLGDSKTNAIQTEIMTPLSTAPGYVEFTDSHAFGFPVESASEQLFIAGLEKCKDAIARSRSHRELKRLRSGIMISLDVGYVIELNGNPELLTFSDALSKASKGLAVTSPNQLCASEEIHDRFLPKSCVERCVEQNVKYYGKPLRLYAVKLFGAQSKIKFRKYIVR